MAASVSSGEKETLAMVAVMETRAKALLERCYADQERYDSVAAYRALAEDVESFVMFVNIVDDRLVEHRVTRRAELKLNCSHVRWQAWVAKLKASNRYLHGLADDARPLALGSREFFDEELDYIDGIESYHAKNAKAHGLPELDRVVVAENRLLLEQLRDSSTALQEFDPDEAAAAARAGAQALQRELWERRRRQRSRKQVTSPEAPMGSLAQSGTIVTLPVVMKWGKTFLAPGAQEVVTDACRQHRISNEALSRSMGISPLTLAMLLRGQDAISSNALRILEAFVSGQGLRMTPEENRPE